jgi:hypothetical protein
MTRDIAPVDRSNCELGRRLRRLAVARERRAHRFVNNSGRDVVFLVISSPTSAGDRTDLTGAGSGCTHGSVST